MGALNNPLSNALNSLLGNAKGLFTGTNPLTQPRVGELFGLGIQGAPLVSTRDYFLLQLESWLTAIPLQSQWIVLIQPYPSCINTSIMQGLETTGGDSKNFDVDKAKNLLAGYPFQRVNGCLFAQSVTTPDETMSTTKAGVDQAAGRGFLPGILSNGRNISNTIDISFLETNTSFSDFVIRPWVIAGEHFGFVARENDSYNRRDPRNVKSTVYVMEYAKTFQNVSMIPRKVWTFFNCAPISVNSVTLGYDEPSQALKISTKWTYTNYAVANSLYLPLPQIIDRVSNIFNGNFPRISPFQGGRGNGNFPQNITGFF
jgi:hypothetical protein